MSREDSLRNAALAVAVQKLGGIVSAVNVDGLDYHSCFSPWQSAAVAMIGRAAIAEAQWRDGESMDGPDEADKAAIIEAMEAVGDAYSPAVFDLAEKFCTDLLGRHFRLIDEFANRFEAGETIKSPAIGVLIRRYENKAQPKTTTDATTAIAPRNLNSQIGGD